jgi:hypothetical protein
MQWPRSFVKAVGGTMVAGRPHSYRMIAGTPGAATTGMGAGLNGANCAASDGGYLPFTNPGSGNTYLSRFQGCATVAGQLLLIDRLWSNTLGVTTGAQSITQPTLPARDALGATNGDGVQLAIEVTATVSATVAVLSALTYTNSGGTGSRAATMIDAFASGAITGNFLRCALQAGDSGVRSVQSINFSTAWTSGAFGLVCYRVIAALELPAALIPNAIDALTSGFPKIYNDSCLSLVFIPVTTTTSNIMGTVVWTQG